MTDDDLVLGIDIGTSSTKGVLVTPSGRIVATAVRRHSMQTPRAGWAEVDPEEVWWADVVAVCTELSSQVEPGQLKGLCVSGIGPCLLVCDSRLQPVRNAILYGVDTRAVRQIADLTTELGADAVFTRCGKALSSQAVGPKMRWLSENEPAAWRRGRRWYNSNSYVVALLTGAYILDHHSASQSDPLYDIHRRDWAHDWTSSIAGHLEMPQLVWPHEVVGLVTSDAAATTGLPAGLPVMAGTIDAWAEAFSAGVRQPGDLMLMYGTTMFFVQVLDRYHAHPMLWTTNGVDPDQYTLAAGMSTSGSLTAWVQELAGGTDFATLVREADEVPAGSYGLIMLPYFAGERTPIFDADARGVLVGLTTQHKRGHLFRAAYEAVAFGVRQIIDLLDTPETPIRRLIAVGGGTQGGLWTQVVTDVTGRAQLIPEQAIGASYGDALLAAIGTGLVPPATDWARFGEPLTPQPENSPVYDRMYQTYQQLYPATREHQHEMARLQQLS